MAITTKRHMISFSCEENFYNQIQETINFIRANAIHPSGTITFSRIVRIALMDFIEKQNKIKKESEDGEFIYKVVTNYQLNLGDCKLSN